MCPAHGGQLRNNAIITSSLFCESSVALSRRVTRRLVPTTIQIRIALGVRQGPGAQHCTAPGESNMVLIVLRGAYRGPWVIGAPAASSPHWRRGARVAVDAGSIFRKNFAGFFMRVCLRAGVSPGSAAGWLDFAIGSRREGAPGDARPSSTFNHIVEQPDAVSTTLRAGPLPSARAFERTG